MQPFILTNTEGDFDLKITVKGGEVNGQAEAIRLAISRALCKINSEHRAELKPEGLLTRDLGWLNEKVWSKEGEKKIPIFKTLIGSVLFNKTMFINIINNQSCLDCYGRS